MGSTEVWTAGRARERELDPSWVATQMELTNNQARDLGLIRPGHNNMCGDNLVITS